MAMRPRAALASRGESPSSGRGEDWRPPSALRTLRPDGADPAPRGAGSPVPHITRYPEFARAEPIRPVPVRPFRSASYAPSPAPSEGGYDEEDGGEALYRPPPRPALRTAEPASPSPAPRRSFGARAGMGPGGGYGDEDSTAGRTPLAPPSPRGPRPGDRPPPVASREPSTPPPDLEAAPPRGRRPGTPAPAAVFHAVSRAPPDLEAAPGEPRSPAVSFRGPSTPDPPATPRRSASLPRGPRPGTPAPAGFLREPSAPLPETMPPRRLHGRSPAATPEQVFLDIKVYHFRAEFFPWPPPRRRGFGGGGGSGWASDGGGLERPPARRGFPRRPAPDGYSSRGSLRGAGTQPEGYGPRSSLGVRPPPAPGDDIRVTYGPLGGGGGDGPRAAPQLPYPPMPPRRVPAPPQHPPPRAAPPRAAPALAPAAPKDKTKAAAQARGTGLRAYLARRAERQRGEAGAAESGSGSSNPTTSSSSSTAILAPAPPPPPPRAPAALARRAGAAERAERPAPRAPSHLWGPGPPPGPPARRPAVPHQAGRPTAADRLVALAYAQQQRGADAERGRDSGPPTPLKSPRDWRAGSRDGSPLYYNSPPPKHKSESAEGSPPYYSSPLKSPTSPSPPYPGSPRRRSRSESPGGGGRRGSSSSPSKGSRRSSLAGSLRGARARASRWTDPSTRYGGHARGELARQAAARVWITAGWDGPAKDGPADLQGDGDWPLETFEPVSLVKWRAGWPLFLLPPHGRVRRALGPLLASDWFEWGVLFVILLSSLCLAVDNPSLAASPRIRDALHAADVAFAALFAGEAALRILHRGLILDRGSYLRNGWNALDLVVSATLIASLAAEAAGLPRATVKALRALRALRPLRLLPRVRGMRIVVMSVLQSAPAVLRVSLMAAVLWSFFATLGQQLFAGRLRYCSDPTVLTKAGCAGTFLDPGSRTVVPREWLAYRENFDSFPAALLTLFEVAMLENWTDIMRRAADATGPESGPRPSADAGAYAFFIAFLIFGVYVALNWYVSATVSAISHAQAALEARAHHLALNYDQRSWRQVLEYATSQELPRPAREARPGTPRAALRALFASRWAEPAVVLLILANVAVMMLQHEDQSGAWDAALLWTNVAFAALFLVECGLRLYAYGLREYFADRWRTFDFAVVVVSAVGVAVEAALSDTAGSRVGAVRALRVVRLARAFRLFRRTKGLMILVRTVVMSLEALVNVGSLLALLFFVYACLGVSLFGTIAKTGRLDDHTSFDNVGYAAIVLFRMLTTEGWNDIMWDCTTPRECPAGADCGYTWAPLYFVSWLFIALTLVMNLFVAAMLESFAENIRQRFYAVRHQDVHAFFDAWHQLDPPSTGFISVPGALPELLRAVGKPLGVAPSASPQDVLLFVRSLRVPHIDGRVHFRVLVHALIDRAYETRLVRPVPRVLQEVRAAYVRRTPALHGLAAAAAAGQRLETVAELYSAARIQAAWRGAALRSRLQRGFGGGGREGAPPLRLAPAALRPQPRASRGSAADFRVHEAAEFEEAGPKGERSRRHSWDPVPFRGIVL